MTKSFESPVKIDVKPGHIETTKGCDYDGKAKKKHAVLFESLFNSKETDSLTNALEDDYNRIEGNDAHA